MSFGFGGSTMRAQIGASWPDHPFFRRYLARISHLREVGRSVAQPGSALASTWWAPSPGAGVSFLAIVRDVRFVRFVKQNFQLQ
jgi:hypothetical protein